LVNARIADRLREARQPSPAAAWAWRRLRETHGALSIGALADELECSHRYLIAEFRAYIGLPPKTVARILRFQRARRLMETGGRFGDIAYTCGYADQAHLNRDFRQFAGITPTEYVAHVEQVKFVQAPEPQPL